MEKNSEHRKILDDLFDAFTILGRGSYVSLYDVKGNLTRYSPAAVELFGLQGEYIPSGDFNWSNYVHPEDRIRYEKVMRSLLEKRTSNYDLTYRTRLKDGTYATFRYIGAVIYDTYGLPELIGGIMINEGLTESTDPVTILRNKYGFFQDIAAAVELHKNCVAVLCGINHMEKINEARGYNFGNAILQQAAWLLQEIIGQDGTVYRMDGAKFAFITESLSPEEVAVKYEKFRRGAQSGLPVKNVRQVLNVSGGMFAFEGGQVSEQTINACLKFAFNDSKFHHNGKLVNYNGAPGLKTDESLELLDEIRNCILLDCEGFSLRYQPVFDAQTEKLTSIEALLCWHSDRFGDVPPSAYVPVLESDFLFEELGYWILRRAMNDARHLLEKNPALILSVNISPAQIVDDLLLEEIDKISIATGFPLQNLCFELTKSCRQIEPYILRRIIRALKRKGILCLIDDFGSGVASIDFLRDLAPDFIKLEKGYIANISEENSGNLQIVRHLSQMASELGTKVCLKGIEDAAIRAVIRQFPVTNVQGHFWSEALSPEEIAEKYFGRDNV
ncbi:MAG: EAL domain-containing protein [Selenomonadaceae bacterium]|nr:EAL domain-containing protein [Selenomonadaceae bacterium]